MDLKTHRCLIRRFRAADLEALVKNANDPLVAARLRDRFPHPYTEDAARDFLSRVADSEHCESFAVEFDGQVIGGVGVHPGVDVARASAEIGYWLGRDYWGRGFATEVVRDLADYLLGNALFCRLDAHTFEGNSASQRVLKKCGFLCEGTLKKAVLKNGRLYDAVLFGRVDDIACARILERMSLQDRPS